MSVHNFECPHTKTTSRQIFLPNLLITLSETSPICVYYCILVSLPSRGWGCQRTQFKIVADHAQITVTVVELISSSLWLFALSALSSSRHDHEDISVWHSGGPFGLCHRGHSAGEYKYRDWLPSHQSCPYMPLTFEKLPNRIALVICTVDWLLHHRLWLEVRRIVQVKRRIYHPLRTAFRISPPPYPSTTTNDHIFTPLLPLLYHIIALRLRWPMQALIKQQSSIEVEKKTLLEPDYEDFLREQQLVSDLVDLTPLNSSHVVARGSISYHIKVPLIDVCRAPW